MINDEYVNAETFKLLKEAGFPTTTCVEPTQAQAMRWLRETLMADISAVRNRLTNCPRWEMSVTAPFIKCYLWTGAEKYEEGIEKIVALTCNAYLDSLQDEKGG